MPSARVSPLFVAVDDVALLGGQHVPAADSVGLVGARQAHLAGGELGTGEHDQGHREAKQQLEGDRELPGAAGGHGSAP